MNILFFAPVPSNENPKISSFIFARIKVLQDLGHSVTVIQFGNILIGFPKLRKLTFGAIHHFLWQFYQIICKRKKKNSVYECKGVKYHYYNFLYFSSYKKFNIWFKKNNFDFIHAHFLWFSYVLPKIKKKCGIPFVVSVHGSDMHTFPFESKKGKYLALTILNSANVVFFVSEFLHKKSIELGWKGKNYIITGNGYFPELFFPKEKKCLDKNNILLGFVGNPIKVKRFDILPDVLFEVRKNFPNTKLLCVGATNKEDDLRKIVKIRLSELNLSEAVTFVDKVPYEQVAEYMRKIDILLLPSKQEGFACVALEAQACGTPVICSANGGIPESTGNIGLCVEDTDNFVFNFTQRVISYINKPYDFNVVVNASKNRTWENVVKKEVAGYAKYINI